MLSKIKRILNSSICTICVCFFSLLSSCAPKFEVENYYNNLRGTDVCQMRNNIVTKHNIKKRYNVSLSFDLWKKTEYENPYGLTIKVSGSKSSASLSSSPTPSELNIMNKVFKNDSRAEIKITKNGRIETLKIVASNATHDSHQEISSFSGNVTTILYSLSCAHFCLTEDQILKIVAADDLSFEVESVSQQNVSGNLSPDNMINIKQFGAQCFVSEGMCY